jgi:hypothetical protein
MSIFITTGKTGTGKTLRFADQVIRAINRNRRYFRRTGILRRVSSNVHFSEQFAEKNVDYILYWSDPMELVSMRDVDIFWDECSTHLDATQWANMPLELKRFLQQHRKRGIDIYATTQSFKNIDVSMRRLVDEVVVCYKIIGSGNPSATKPIIRYPWGLILSFDVKDDTFEKDELKLKRFPFGFLFIRRGLTAIYDTKQEIEVGKYPPLRHILRECGRADCPFHKVIHI